MDNILFVISDIGKYRILTFLASRVSHFTYTLFSIKRRLQNAYKKNRNDSGSVASIATVAMGTAALSFTSPVFAGGDHHDHGEKKCKDNDDNNCNDTHKTQKIKEKNYCEIENENKDHSKDNTNDNELSCVNEAQNLKNAEQIDSFGDGALEPLSAPDVVTNDTSTE